MKSLLQGNSLPRAEMQGTDATGHFPKELQMVAGCSQPSFPCFTSLRDHLCWHSVACRWTQPAQIQPLGWSHMAVLSSSSQAAATRPGRQLLSLSNAASDKAAFCWEHGLVLITTDSKPSLFFLLLQLQALKMSCVSSCDCHHTSMQHMPWHVCEHSWVSTQNQIYFALQACAYSPHNLLTAKSVGLPFPVEDQRVYLNVSNSTSE